METGVRSTTESLLSRETETSVKRRMTRIFSKGGDLDFAENFDWDKHPNISDYDIVFLNLRDLEKNFEDYVGYEESKEAENKLFEIADPEKIVDVVLHGGDIYAVLPTTKEKTAEPDQPPKKRGLLQSAMREEAGITPVATRVDFFDWVPTQMNVEEEPPSQSVDEETIDPDWQWYLQDSFEWTLCLEQVGATRTQNLDIRFQPLVVNRYKKQLATEIVHTAITSRYADQEIGSIYLLPLMDGWAFEDLAEKIMERFYPEVEVETVPGAPDWITEFSTPRQQELEREIGELKSKMNQEKQLKELLYGTGDSLEEAVYQAFQQLGFDSEGEEKGRRDGLLFTDDRIYVLEIHGTEKGIKKGKLRQLYEWQENNEDRWDRPVTGIYVVNPKRTTRPEERNISVPPDTIDYIEGKDLHILRSPNLYTALSKVQDNQLTRKEIKQRLQSSDPEIRFD